MLEIKERIDDTARTSKGIADRGGAQAQAATQAAADRAKEATSGVLGAVKDKLQDVADSACDLAGKATDKAQQCATSVGDAALHAKDKAQEWATSVGDKAQQVASATVENVGDLGRDLTALIRRYPLPALLVGVGAGFLLAQVLHPSSSKRA